MNAAERRELLELLRAVADEQRLNMVALMSERERTVSELAAQLQLSEPTVSHHVSKLRAAGLLSLRMEGNYRHYSISENRMQRLKDLVGQMDSPLAQAEQGIADTAWIDGLDWDAADKKVLRDYMEWPPGAASEQSEEVACDSSLAGDAVRARDALFGEAGQRDPD